MSTIYEINMSNAHADVNTGRVKQDSKIVEVFSALTEGRRPEVDDKTKDKSVATLKELSSKAIDGDTAAKSEINSIIGFLLSRSCWRLCGCLTLWVHIVGLATMRHQ